MYYVVIPTEINESTFALMSTGWTKSECVAKDYAKQILKFHPVIVEYDVTDELDIYKQVKRDFDVSLDLENELCVYDLPKSESVGGVNRYIVTGEQRILLDEYSPPLTQQYLEELLESLHLLLKLSDYMVSDMANKFRQLLEYFVYKYISRVILFNLDDMNRFPGFMLKSGLQERLLNNLSHKDSDWIDVCEDDIIYEGVLISKALRGYMDEN